MDTHSLISRAHGFSLIAITIATISASLALAALEVRPVWAAPRLDELRLAVTAPTGVDEDVLDAEQVQAIRDALTTHLAAGTAMAMCARDETDQIVGDAAYAGMERKAKTAAEAGEAIGATHIVVGEVKESRGKYTLEVEVIDVAKAKKIADHDAKYSNVDILTTDVATFADTLAESMLDELGYSGNEFAAALQARAAQLTNDYRSTVPPSSYEAAVQMLTAALHRLPGDKATLLARAKAHHGLRAFEAMRADAEEALRNNLTSPLANALLAISIAAVDIRRAVDTAQAAFELSDQELWCHYALGFVAMRADDGEFAIQAFNNVLRNVPSFSWASYGLSLVLNRTGQYEEAIAKLTKAIDVEPDNAALYNARARNRGDNRDLEGARADAKRACECDPTSADYLNTYGYLCKVMREYDAALKAYDMALALDPALPVTLRNRAHLLSRVRNDHQAALDDLNEALRLSPDYVDGLIERGVVLNRLARPREAISDLERALKLEPGRPDAAAVLGEAHSILGQFDVAERMFDDVLATAPENELGFVYFHRGMLNMRRGQVTYENKYYGSAIEDLDEAIRLDPGFDESFLQRGVSYHFLRQYERSIDDLTEYLKRVPGQPYALSWRSRSDYFAGRYDDALNDASMALELQPDDASALHIRGSVNAFQNDDPQAAVDDLERAVQIDPTFFPCWSDLGQALVMLGRRDEAERAFDTAIEHAPESWKAHYRAVKRNSLGR